MDTGWARLGDALGMPCKSWSRSRGVRGAGPRMVRTAEFLLGLPNLGVADHILVEDGNTLLRFAISAIHLCMRLNVAWSLENPATSDMGIMKSVMKLMRHPSVTESIIEFCMLQQEPWRKSTRFLSCGLCLPELDCYRCLGGKRGTCKRTGEPHVVLMGKDEVSGRFLTQIVEPYPFKLCKILALGYVNGFARTKARGLAKAIAA